jgi:DNA-binding MarR family transcriptional regulator
MYFIIFNFAKLKKYMSLESEIKQQKPFQSSFQKATVNIMFTNNWIYAQESSIFRVFDLTIQQYNVLRILRGQYPKPVTVNTIIERMIDKMSNASRLVDKLLVKKLVLRKEAKHDRRACDVIITKKGLEILSQIDEIHQTWEKETFTKITSAEAEQLSELLDKLRGQELS